MNQYRIVGVFEKNRRQIVEFIFSLFVLTALFGGLIRRAYNADTITYMVYAKDDADVRIRAGRYLVALFDVILYKLGIKTTDFMPVLLILSLLVLALTMVVLLGVFKRFFSSENILFSAGFALAVGLGFYNVLFSEYFMFTEVTFFYSVGFLMAVIGVKLFVESAKGKAWAYLLFLLAACTYQYAVVFAAIVLAFYYMLLNDFRWTKKAVVDELLGTILPMSTGIICMISIKIVGQIYPDLASVKPYTTESISSKLADVISSLLLFAKSSYTLIAAKYVPGIILLLSIGLCIYLLVKGKGIKEALFFAVVVLGSFVLMLVIPLLGTGFSFPPRMSFCIYLIQGLVIVTAMHLLKEGSAETFLKITAYVVIGYVWIQMIACSFITSGRYVSNTLDKNYSRIILNEIEKYEERTGVTVTKLSVTNDLRAPAFYEESRTYYGQINERIIGQSTRSLIEAIWGRHFEHGDFSQEVYDEYFAGKDWDFFDVNEQLVIVDDTAYLCVY